MAKTQYRCDGCAECYTRVYACRFKKCGQSSLCRACMDGHVETTHRTPKKGS